MQFGTGDIEVKGWSDQEVDEALGYLSSIEQSQTNMNEWVFAITDTQHMIVFLFAVLIGYLVSVWYMPATTDIGRWK